MTDEGRDRAIAAIWKGIERLAGAIERLSDRLVVQALDGEVPQKAEQPEQPPLPGMPEDDWTPPEIEAKKPREWCNTVRVYEAIWKHFGTKFKAFNLADLCRDDHFLSSVAAATRNRVSPASLSKLISVMRRASAIYLDEKGFYGKGYYRCNEPTDELREAVERTAKKRAAAKEVSNG